jgi:multidrug transporter EmrE-like cation transporter
MFAYLITHGILQVLLQTMNLVWLREPWPHVLTVLLGLLLASVLFIRLLRGVIGRPA